MSADINDPNLLFLAGGAAEVIVYKKQKKAKA